MIARTPLDRVMVLPSRLGSKAIESPLAAPVMAARKVPVPLSAVDVTIQTVGTVRSSRTSRCKPRAPPGMLATMG